MKEKIFKNFSLKVLSALCAIVLWTIIVNIYDPTTSVTVSNVNVQLINTESLTEKGYDYEVVDGSKISVYLRGPKSVITDIRSNDIVATADLSNITAFADYVDIDVKVVKDGRAINNIEVAPRTTVVKLDIENRVTKEFTVHSDTMGTVAGGYVLLGQSVSPEMIRITGPTSSIDAISTVKAVCDISGASTDIRATVPIVLYDAQGNAINDEKLSLSIKEADFSGTLGTIKTVPLTCMGTVGRVADGYMITGIEASVREVSVASSDLALLERVTGINIPESEFNVTGSKEDHIDYIKISDYLEQGLTLTSNDTVEVRIKIEPIESRKISVGSDKISFTDLENDLSAEIIEQPAVEVTVSGDKASVSKVREDHIKIGASLKDLGIGEHTVKLNVSVDASCSVSGEYSVRIRITGNSQESETH